MRSFFSIDSKFMQLLSTAADYIILNLLFVLTCIPIITIGAAKTAMYRIMFDDLEQRGAPYRRYFKTFWKEFKTATPLFLLKGGVTLFISFELWVVANNEIPLQRLTLILLLVVLALFNTLFSSLFAQVAMFDSTRRQYLRNSIFIALTKPIHCLGLMLMDLLPLLLVLYNPATFGMLGLVWVFFYFTVTGHLSARLLYKPFEEYIAQAEDDDDASSEEQSDEI